MLTRAAPVVWFRLVRGRSGRGCPGVVSLGLPRAPTRNQQVPSDMAAEFPMERLYSGKAAEAAADPGLHPVTHDLYNDFRRSIDVREI